MRISVIGTGYVGLVTGICFAEMGNNVWCCDKDDKKIDNLKNSVIPIYEPGLERILQGCINNNQINFTTNIKECLENTDICFICVGTPMGDDGSADLTYVKSVASDIGRHMLKHTYVVNKSTVPVGTADIVSEIIQEKLDERNSNLTFDIISNPEFLKEGSAIADCMKPDRIIVGASNQKAFDKMKEVYKPYVLDTHNFITMDIKSAEMTKYAANAMLATKISFINEIANICENVGADINKVRLGIGSDSRIGYKFIYPGCGYGGSCFPKDVQALIYTSKNNDYKPLLLQSVEDVNNKQKLVLADKVKKYFKDVKGMHFAVWGLAFKPNTDDMRDAPAISLIETLINEGATITAYDPKAMNESKEYYLKNTINYANTKYEALKEADALILVTEWKEFRSPDFMEIKDTLKTPIIFDGRNQYDTEVLKEYGLEHVQIGVI